MNRIVVLILFLFSFRSFASESVELSLAVDLTKCVLTDCRFASALTKLPIRVDLVQIDNTKDYAGTYRFDFSKDGYHFFGQIDVQKRDLPPGNRPKYIMTLVWIWLKSGSSDSTKAQPLGMVEVEEFNKLNEIAFVAPAIEDGFLTLTPWVRVGPVGLTANEGDQK